MTTEPELFQANEVESLSPRLAWMKRHGIETSEPTGLPPEFQNSPAPDEWSARHEATGTTTTGLTEFQCLVLMASKLGIPLYKP